MGRESIYLFLEFTIIDSFNIIIVLLDSRCSPAANPFKVTFAFETLRLTGFATSAAAAPAPGLSQ